MSVAFRSGGVKCCWYNSHLVLHFSRPEGHLYDFNMPGRLQLSSAYVDWSTGDINRPTRLYMIWFDLPLAAITILPVAALIQHLGLQVALWTRGEHLALPPVRLNHVSTCDSSSTDQQDMWHTWFRAPIQQICGVLYWQVALWSRGEHCRDLLVGIALLPARVMQRHGNYLEREMMRTTALWRMNLAHHYAETYL